MGYSDAEFTDNRRDGEPYDEWEFSLPRDHFSKEDLDTESLDQWLTTNYGLWRLGLDLAERARQYRREYRHVPFNQTGWFSPN